MIIWLNGPYGVGKTESADALVEADPTWHRFDPEKVGFLVLSQLQDFGYDDFQHLSAWRKLTPLAVDVIARETRQDLVVPQTVLTERYWLEIAAGIRTLGHQLHHVLIEASPDTVRRRITEDATLHRAAGWRLEHLPDYLDARSGWLTTETELVIDSSDLNPRAVAQTISAAARVWVEQDRT
ncbi:MULTISPECIES: AAA family ATPase [Nocardia]|uniref:AAA family ATPase n=1 Tax=Nocardia TaxID=1817 RepID=UPI0003089ECC|nr:MULTISPECIES: AAA family ATPase [Nocardia]